MITKINKVKDFGIFKNFNNEGALSEFKTFNLIYGWNYSGKTTLSRVFRCLEKGKLHEDYPNSTFELESNGIKHDNTFSSKPNIRVFNSDFVKENLKWDTEDIEPILLLGEENIELQKELKQKEREIKVSEQELVDLKEQRKSKKTRIDKAVTDKAKEIGNLLSIRTFDTRHFLKIIENVKVDLATFILNETDFDKYKSRAISNEQKPIIDPIDIPSTDIFALKSEVKTILQHQATSQNKIQKLLDNQQISDWVEKGKEIHEKKTECEFCGSILPTDLLERLNEHFSEDYEQLKTNIEVTLASLNGLKINNLLPVETEFYTDLQPNFREKKPLLETEICKFNDAIASLIKDLENKKEKPFDKLELTAFTDNTEALRNALTDFNGTIAVNNKRTSDFTNEKNGATEKIKEHYAAMFEEEETYSAAQRQLEDEQTVINDKASVIEAQKQEILRGTSKNSIFFL